MCDIWKRYCKCVCVRTCQRWFSKFSAGDLSLLESATSKIANDVLRSMLENNPHLTNREIAEEIGIHHTNVGDHIKSLRSFESVPKAVVGYFNSQDENFYKTEIHRLPERWQQVVTNNGSYIID
ncbi:histone-lysine N-methyltransferase SETMAR [Trichonephila clavipes]|nr:histone-lysine N-methyltransferase SETMAR [Trichonephila clavipes]